MGDVEKAKEAEAEIQAEVKSSPRPSPSKSTGTMSLLIYFHALLHQSFLTFHNRILSSVLVFLIKDIFF